MNRMKQWLLYTCVSAGLGFVLGSILAYAWFFFSLIFFRYGDSGPSWVNIVNDVVFYGGLIIGISGGQLLFALRNRAESFVAKLAKRKRAY